MSKVKRITVADGPPGREKTKETLEPDPKTWAANLQVPDGSGLPFGSDRAWINMIKSLLRPQRRTYE
jgi:hypothetical protein